MFVLIKFSIPVNPLQAENVTITASNRTSQLTAKLPGSSVVIPHPNPPSTCRCQHLEKASSYLSLAWGKLNIPEPSTFLLNEECFLTILNSEDLMSSYHKRRTICGFIGAGEHHQPRLAQNSRFSLPNAGMNKERTPQVWLVLYNFLGPPPHRLLPPLVAFLISASLFLSKLSLTFLAICPMRTQQGRDLDCSAALLTVMASFRNSVTK